MEICRVLAHCKTLKEGTGLPVAICWDNIIDSELLAYLLNAQMKSVRLKLFASHVRHNRRRESHETCSFILRRVAPTVSLLATSLAIR